MSREQKGIENPKGLLQYEDKGRQVEIVIRMETGGRAQEESDKLLKIMGFGDRKAMRKADREKMKQWSAEYDEFLLSRQNL